ncbi:MAG: diadenylate cyclase [Phycisphaerae bacterium]
MFQAVRSYFQRLRSPAYDPLHVLIELVLIGLVVYACVRFLRGTRGERLFSGVAFVLVLATLLVNVVAKQLDLERINVLYTPFVAGMFLVALVVFQPELRRGLMRLGETRWLRPWSREVGEIVNHLVAAAEYLSKNKIGAIIAIEREVGLGSIIEAGTRLDAELSADLLKTIFWPGSALHDLGVVIQRGRIAAAGCQFPLAESGELDHALGGRHRAAVGLSNDSDAIVLSSAKRPARSAWPSAASFSATCNLRRSVAPCWKAWPRSGQRPAEATNAQPEPPRTGPMWERTKTGATVVVLTGLIWFVADQFNQASLRVRLRLRLATRPHSDRIILQPPQQQQYTATVVGPNRLIRRLQSDRDACLLDFEHFLDDETPPGRHTIPVQQILQALPRFNGLAVRDVTPPTLRFVVDRLIWQPAAVELRTDPYRVSDPLIDPSEVRLRVPESLASDPSQGRLRAIADLTTRLANQPINELLELRDVPVTATLGNRPVPAEPDRVTVRLRISRKRKKLNGVVVHFSGSAMVWSRYAVQVSNDLVDIQVVGPDHLIDALQPYQVHASVQVSTDDFRPDRAPIRRKVNFQLPPGVVLDQEPPEIEFQLVAKAASMVPE